MKYLQDTPAHDGVPPYQIWLHMSGASEDIFWTKPKHTNRWTDRQTHGHSDFTTSHPPDLISEEAVGWG